MRISLCRLFREVSVLEAALGTVPVKIGEPDGAVSGIATDSREVGPGDLFVALRGRCHNGCDFISEALSRGAVAVLCDTAGEPPRGSYWLFRTTSVEKALFRLAAARRRKMKAPVIAVSGSTGKTTVKELVATLLSEVGTVCKSEGNFNSTVGLPLSLLSMEEADYYVLEIGINHVGEMEPMSMLLAPDLAVLTNVGTAHVGHFGSTEILLREKCNIAAGMTEGGILLLGEGVPREATEGIAPRALRIGVDFHLLEPRQGSFGIVADFTDGARTVRDLSWPVPGSIGRSLLSFGGAVGTLFGLDDERIRRGIARAAPAAPRMKMRNVGHFRILDDTYNASPEAMVAALEALYYLGGGKTAALLGDMGELGDFARPLHEAVGECAARSGIGDLFLYGELASSIATGAVRGGMPPERVHRYTVGQEEALADRIRQVLPQGCLLLCKASRSMALERVIRLLGREE